jgi:resuscitation-promoting factor RpfB
VRARPAVLAMQGVLLAALVAGPFVYVHASKSVTLEVDGKVSEVHTFASTVGDVLHDENVTLGARDAVAPGSDTALAAGLRIEVIHARPVTLVVGTTTTHMWTTAQTVSELAQQLGDRFDAAYLSVPRSARIPLAGLDMVVRLPVSVTVSFANHKVAIVTTAATWSQALVDAGITVGPLDQLSVQPDSAPVGGQHAVITHVRSNVFSRAVAIAFTTRQIADSSLYTGTSRVVHSGAVGRRVQTWRYTLHDGAVVRAQLIRAVISKQPVAEVVAVGTKARPVYRPKPTPQPQAHRSVGGGVSGLNWSALAACESGGNPRAVGGGGLYFGLYQFMLSTWHSLGGSGNPVDASAGDQTYRAQLLYLRAGASSWPYCGHFLFS